MPKDTNPKTIYGEAKSPLGLIPGNALVHCAEALRDGADKYGPANWRVDPVSASTYWFALLRHGFQWWDGEDVDPASMVLHLGAMMANAAILIDALESGTLIDDRPPASNTATLIRAHTRPVGAAQADDHRADDLARDRAFVERAPEGRDSSLAERLDEWLREVVASGRGVVLVRASDDG